MSKKVVGCKVPNKFGSKKIANSNPMAKGMRINKPWIQPTKQPYNRKRKMNEWNINS